MSTVSTNMPVNFNVVRGPETTTNKNTLLKQIEAALQKNTSFSITEIKNMLSNSKNSLAMFEFGDRLSNKPNDSLWSDIVGLTINFKKPQQPILMISLQMSPALFEQVASLPEYQKGIQRVEEVTRRNGLPCFTIYIDLAQCTKGTIIPLVK